MNSQSKLAEFERRFADILAGLFVTLCLGHRVFAASRMFLNPEEAFSILIPVDAGFSFIIHHPFVYSHPPLSLLVFRLLQEFSFSDFAMKAPFVLAGAVFPLVTYFWVKRKWGVCPAWIALILLALSPNLFRLGLDARGFTLALLFMAVALYSLQRAVDECAPAWMGAAAIATMLAISSEYMGLWFWVTTVLWFLWRMREGPVSRRTRMTWMSGQVAIVALVVGLQLLRSNMIRGDGFRIGAKQFDYLAGQYLLAGQNPVAFVGSQTLAVFGYLFSSTPVGIVGMGAFLIGLVAVWRFLKAEDSARSRADLALLIGPFLAGAGAAVIGVYPYGASRHSTHLMIFMAVGVALGLAPLFRRRLAAIWLAGLVLAPVWYFQGPNDPMTAQRMDLLRQPFLQALDFLKAKAPRGTALMTDQESAFVLSYYLEPERKWPRARDGILFRTAGYTFFAPRWSHASLAEIKQDLPEFRERFRLGPEIPVWGIDTGFQCGVKRSWDREPEIRNRLLTAREFGPLTAIYRLPPYFGDD